MMNDLFGSSLPEMRKPERKLPPLSRRREAEEEPDELAPTRNRLLFATVFFAICFSVLGFRLTDVMLLQGSRSYQPFAELPETEPSFRRADIVDRNGELVATNLSTASVYANPKEVLSPEEAAQELTKVLPEFSYKELERKLSADSTFVWLKRNITPSEQYAVNRLGIPGLYFKRSESRVYPHRNLLAHVTGFVGIDNHGLAGVEKALDDVLLSEAYQPEPMQLSIDMRAQHILHDELSKGMAAFSAKGAAGVVLDVHSGELVALVSLPDFDPNNPPADEHASRFNRASVGLYEMGSTFKTFTTAAALDSKTVDMKGGYDATHPLRYARHVIRDYHAKKRWLSVPEIYMYSSNIGTAKMAMDMGTPHMQEFVRRLGLTKPVSIELPGRASPLVPNPWRDINTMTISYGHGLSVSMLHMVRALAVMVNGGYLKPLTLIKGGNGRNPEGVQVISEETSDAMRKLLRLVVAKGTGGKADVEGYVVGGKTGTAEKPMAGGYNRRALISSFASAFPMHDPKYVMVVMFDEPQGTKETWGYATGGWTAAPVTGRIIHRLGPALGIRPVNENAQEIRESLAVELQPKGVEVAAN